MEQVRKIKPTRISVSGRVICKGKAVAYESTLERDFLIVQNYHPDIKNIVAQPVTIKFNKNGREYPYTPDFFVEYHEFANRKNMIIEVKPEALWRENWRDWSDKWKAMQRYCRQNNMVFHVYDENRIRTIALDNINIIKALKNTAIDEADIKAVTEQVELMGITTIDYLLTRFYTGELLRKHGLRVIYHLLATQQLYFNLFEELTTQSEVWGKYE